MTNKIGISLPNKDNLDLAISAPLHTVEFITFHKARDFPPFLHKKGIAEYHFGTMKGPHPKITKHHNLKQLKAPSGRWSFTKQNSRQYEPLDWDRQRGCWLAGHSIQFRNPESSLVQ